MTTCPAAEILLIEDNPRDAELALRALRSGHPTTAVIWLKDGAEALAWFFGTDTAAAPPRSPPAVVLLDLKLPKVDGLEVLRQLKAHARTQLIPVVMLTSSREELDLVQSYRLGANSFLVKAMEFDKFEATLTLVARYWLQLNQTPAASEPRPPGPTHAPGAKPDAARPRHPI
jgi:two-component system response regulator